MKRRKNESEADLWICADQVISGPGNPFYKRQFVVAAPDRRLYYAAQWNRDAGDT